MLKIGPYRLPSNVLLSPLSGISDLSFRLICREFGAAFCYFEMIDCNALLHGPNSPKVKEILSTNDDDSPIAAQLLGSTPDQMLKAAQVLIEKAKKIKYLEVNAACPAKKVSKKKAGAYLLKDPDTLSAIIRRLSSELDLPVTVKLRIGYDRYDRHEFIESVKGCEIAGASALFIHGRTRKQGYSGEINYGAIREAKEAVGIPVLGSGDLLDKASIEKMFNLAGCDGIAVARGAMGNPWIFKGVDPAEVELSERISVLKRHLFYMKKYRFTGHHQNIGIMRKIAILYLSSVPNAAEMRSHLSKAKDRDELLAAIDLAPRIAG
ncbi:MAG TPA: tRNA-dihydrouridine synthase [Candidatus Omnitrophota bacterium]|nr:tRNA-dihydrouridine synthase [Candidatus Omnitrophota bacterium]